jgi:hypothetical protein
MVFLAYLLAAVTFLILLWALRPIFTRLRIAIELADRVQTMEGIVQSLQFEWTDTLDKLLAREERWRKRYKAEVNRAYTPEVPPAVEHPQSGGDSKADLRVRLAAARQAGGRS